MGKMGAKSSGPTGWPVPGWSGGSIGVGYGDFLSPTDDPQESEEGAYAKLYVPCYEKDKILVFALGSGEDEVDGW